MGNLGGLQNQAAECTAPSGDGAAGLRDPLTEAVTAKTPIGNLSSPQECGWAGKHLTALFIVGLCYSTATPALLETLSGTCRGSGRDTVNSW